MHVSTVSRVINGRGDVAVRPETRQRILEAAETLQYRPHAIARGLKLSTTGTLGLLVPSLRNPVNSPIVRGAFDRAWERSFVLVLAEDTGESDAAEDAYRRLIEEGRIDGLLIQSARLGNPHLDHFATSSVPCVFMDRAHPRSGRNVTMRDDDAGRIVAEHFLELGHRALAHLAGPSELDTVTRRRLGFVSAARDANVEPVVAEAGLTEEAGHRAMLELIAHPARPTAVFIANISQALGAVAAVRESGLGVPGDLSLVCHDDDPVCDYLDAPLTAIRMPLHELGSAAVDALLEQVARRATAGPGDRDRADTRATELDGAATTLKVTAAILVEPGRPLVLDQLDLEPPRRGEVLVRLLASGICRSDLSLLDGKWPAPLPMVLGHEGAGVVEAVGDDVDVGRIGESVVLTFTPGCGRCRFCLQGRVNLCLEAARCMDDGVLPDGTTRLSRNGVAVHHLALVSSFATHAVVPAQAAIPVPAELDPALGCLLGCGVLTGVVSVTRRANVRPGESVAVFACGGVGLATVAGAALVSAYPIVAVDPVAEKRELALTLGATHAVDPTSEDPVSAVRRLVPDGVDHAFEALGAPAVVEQAVAATRTGGTTVLIGQPAIGVTAALPVYELTQFEHDVLGTHIGGATPALEIPALAALVVAGRLDLAPLVTHRYPLAQIAAALDTTRSGIAGRVVLDLA